MLRLPRHGPLTDPGPIATLRLDAAVSAVSVKAFRRSAFLQQPSRIEPPGVGRLGHLLVGGTDPVAEMGDEVVLAVRQTAQNCLADPNRQRGNP